MSDALPQGWAQASFGAITVNHDGRRVPLKASDRAARQGKYRYFGAQGVIDHIDDYLFDGTYLLIAEDGANLISRAQPIAQIAKGQFWVNNHAHVVETLSGISLSFLKHFLNGSSLRGAVRGTAQPKLTQADLNRISIPVPPTAEQGRIVAAIEEQFSRMDAGLLALGRVRQNLKRIRHAALYHIIGFELGAQLPNGWEWVTIKDVAGDSSTPVLTGPFGTALSRSDFRSDGIPVLTIGCLTSDGIRTDLAPRVSPTKANALRRYTLEPSDVLFSRMATVGRAAVVGEAEAGSLINYHLMRLRLDQSIILPEFLVLLCRGSRAIQQYLSETNHGVTRPGINTRQLLSLPMALPPINEQQRILHIARFWDEVTSQLDKGVALAIARARQLRSSVLAAAFSGGLVPQDPADEPASDLLQRIAAERASSNGRSYARTREPPTPRENIVV